MSSGLRLILALTLWLLIFSVTTCAQTGAVDSGQLVLTLRAPHPNEETDIADPLDAPHALALYGKLAHVSSDSSHLAACPTYIITTIVRCPPKTASVAQHTPD